MLRMCMVCVTTFILVLPSAVESIAQGAGALIQTVVLTGQSAPGSGGARFTGLGRPSINSAGTVAFRAEMTPTEVSFGTVPGKVIPGGVFLATKGSVSRVVVTGDPVPNTPSIFTGFGHPSINDAGIVAFKGRIGLSYENSGLFLYTNGRLLSIARTDEPAPFGDHRE